MFVNANVNCVQDRFSFRLFRPQKGDPAGRGFPARMVEAGYF
jgi:hypothetical protein